MSAADKFKKAGAAARFEAAKGPAIPEGPNKPEAQSQGETALHSGLQGVSVGLADEAQGLIGGATEGGAMALEALGLKDAPEDLADPVTGESTRKSALQRLLKSYEQARDWERSAVHQGERDNPKTALASEVVGSLVAPGPKGTKGLKGLARVGEGALTGAKMGAAYGFGKSEGEGAGDVALDTAIGGGVGAGTGAVIGGVSALAQPMLKKLAERQAMKAAGVRGGIKNVPQSVGIENQHEFDAMGREILDHDLIPVFGSKAGVADRAESLRQQAGNSIGAELQKAQLSGVPAQFDEAAWAASEPYFNSTALAQAKSGRPVRDLVKALYEQAERTPGDWERLNTTKSDLGKNINWNAVPKGTGALVNKTYGALNENIAGQLERAVGQESADALRAANADYGLASKVGKLAKDTGLRESANSTMGLREMLATITGGGLGAALGGPGGAMIGAPALATVANLSRKYGPAGGATLADALQKGGTANLPIGGLTGALSDVEAQSLTTEEEKKRALAERLRSLLGD